jgi:hypothetical protein
MRRAPLAAVLVVALSGACSGELTFVDPAGGDGGGEGGGGGGGGGDDAEARQLWTSDVIPLLTAARPKGACVACHQGTATAGPAFLGATQADNFDTITAGALVAGTPAASRFLTIGEHTGNGFCTGVDTPAIGCAADESAVVSNWILVLNGQ